MEPASKWVVREKKKVPNGLKKKKKKKQLPSLPNKQLGDSPLTAAGLRQELKWTTLAPKPLPFFFHTYSPLPQQTLYTDALASTPKFTSYLFQTVTLGHTWNVRMHLSGVGVWFDSSFGGWAQKKPLEPWKQGQDISLGNSWILDT